MNSGNGCGSKNLALSLQLVWPRSWSPGSGSSSSSSSSSRQCESEGGYQLDLGTLTTAAGSSSSTAHPQGPRPDRTTVAEGTAEGQGQLVGGARAGAGGVPGLPMTKAAVLRCSGQVMMLGPAGEAAAGDCCPVQCPTAQEVACQSAHQQHWR
jgi:hypothetical protein